MLRILLFLMCIMGASRAWAAVCANGYYLLNGVCTECGDNGYCNNDTKYDCPPNNQDLSGIVDGEVLGQSQGFAWYHPVAYDISHCAGDTSIRTEGGEYLAECAWNGSNYYEGCNGDFLWNVANSGYYLSGYKWSSWVDWYSGVKPCTNGPANSHYTGPGTPDSLDGTVVDVNDCPWECDDGFVNVDGVCQPLCAFGVQYLKTSMGVSVPVFANKLSQPALSVGMNGGVCYVMLETGQKSGAVNVVYSGNVYHMVE